LTTRLGNHLPARRATPAFAAKAAAQTGYAPPTTLAPQREAVPVSSNGTLAGYFVAPHEYEELRKLKGMRRRFLTAELSDEEAERIASSRMDPRHDHLNKLLDPK
jgi:hypothetical protein